jgi:hypothetical protein
MARTGFYDSTQDLYLPKDSNTWADLTGGWDTYTGWYQNLSASTELEWTSNIIDFGYQHKVYPVILITTRRDGATTTAGNYGTDFPKITIEAGNASDLSDATSIVMTRTSNPTYTGLGAKRYYRVTITINSGTNSQPQGLRGIEIRLLTDAITETIEQFDSSTVDDGSTTSRVIPTNSTYSDISFVGVTPTTLVEDTVVTGVSSDGSSLILYVATGYVNTGYFVGDVGSSTVTTSNISIPPLVQLVATSTDSFTIRIFKPNTAADTNCTFDAFVSGLPPVAMDVNGNLIRTA